MKSESDFVMNQLPSFVASIHLSHSSITTIISTIGTIYHRRDDPRCQIRKQRTTWDYQKQQSSSSFKVRRLRSSWKSQADRSEILPPDLGCTKEAKDVLVDCCVGEYFWRRSRIELIVEWIKLLSTQSNEVCESSAKKTISPEHVTEALKVSSISLFLLFPNPWRAEGWQEEEADR